jgi:hypothetical protein
VFWVSGFPLSGDQPGANGRAEMCSEPRDQILDKCMSGLYIVQLKYCSVEYRSLGTDHKPLAL